MNAKVVQPFVTAACNVLDSEIRTHVDRHHVSLKKECLAQGEVCVLIGVTGHVRGTVALVMPEGTALNFISNMVGEPYAAWDEVGESALGEIANVISGTASIALAESGQEMTICPPTLLRCHGEPVSISTIRIPMYAVEMDTELGSLEMDIALSEAA